MSCQSAMHYMCYESVVPIMPVIPIMPVVPIMPDGHNFIDLLMVEGVNDVAGDAQHLIRCNVVWSVGTTVPKVVLRNGATALPEIWAAQSS